METIEILKQARTYIARGYCDGAFARDEAGDEELARSPGAVRWCLDGAIQASLYANGFHCSVQRKAAVFHEHRLKAVKALLDVRGAHVEDSDGTFELQCLSDDSDQQGVLDWLDDAIKEAA